MQFTTEGPIPAYLRPVISEFSRAVAAGWPSAALSRAFIHVGPDDTHGDVIYFDIEDIMGGTTTLACAPEESTDGVRRRAHAAWVDISRRRPATSGANTTRRRG